MMRTAIFMMIALALPATSTADPRRDPATADLGEAADDEPRAGRRRPASGSQSGDASDPSTGAGGPPISAVLSAAYVAAGLDRDPGRGWIRRARIAGLVPWVTVRTTRDASWQDERSEVGHGTALEVRATWRLDRLLFDGRELQIAALEASRRRERRRLAARVIRAYFVWCRAAGAEVEGDARTTPRVAEAAAELDALTDGWFSEELARLPGGTSGSRTARPGTP